MVALAAVERQELALAGMEFEGLLIGRAADEMALMSHVVGGNAAFVQLQAVPVGM